MRRMDAPQDQMVTREAAVLVPFWLTLDRWRRIPVWRCRLAFAGISSTMPGHDALW